MDEFLKLDGYIMICTDRDYVNKTISWKFTYKNYEKETQIERENFKSYDECLTALKSEHERISNNKTKE